jgi:pyruvate-formate lyase-activating enzyme
MRRVRKPGFRSAPYRPKGCLGRSRATWCVTLSCNLKCSHCGSRAGAPRANELTTAECVALIGELARAGTKEVVLIGGEAYLRPDWLVLVEEITRHGILCGLQTGARALTEAKIEAAARAGLKTVGVSIDGGPATHDRLRGVKGSHAYAVAAIRNARKHGMMATANSQVNRRNSGEMRQILDTIIEAGATAWQIQLTVPMGNAADDPSLILQPYELGALMPELFALFGGRVAARAAAHSRQQHRLFRPYEAAWRSTSGRPEYYGGARPAAPGSGSRPTARSRDARRCRRHRMWAATSATSRFRKSGTKAPSSSSCAIRPRAARGDGASAASVTTARSAAPAAAGPRTCSPAGPATIRSAITKYCACKSAGGAR